MAASCTISDIQQLICQLVIFDIPHLHLSTLQTTMSRNLGIFFTVQFWKTRIQWKYIYLHGNGARWMDRQTDRQTDRHINRHLSGNNIVYAVHSITAWKSHDTTISNNNKKASSH